MKLICCLAMVVLFLSTVAYAEDGCHFNSEGAIFCFTTSNGAQNAANAFTNFGFDINRAALSYNKQLLHAAGCGIVFKVSKPGREAKAEVRSHGQIATPSGWVPIFLVSFDGTRSGHFDSGAYVAQAYMSKECKVIKTPTPEK